MTLMRKKRTTFNENCTKRRNKKRSAGGRLHSYISIAGHEKKAEERGSLGGKKALIVCFCCTTMKKRYPGVLSDQSIDH